MGIPVKVNIDSGCKPNGIAAGRPKILRPEVAEYLRQNPSVPSREIATLFKRSEPSARQERDMAIDTRSTTIVLEKVHRNVLDFQISKLRGVVDRNQEQKFLDPTEPPALEGIYDLLVRAAAAPGQRVEE